jgi:inhibitor of cysteine peptidase
MRDGITPHLLAAWLWLGTSVCAPTIAVADAVTQGNTMTERILTRADNGHSIAMPVGASLSIQLDESPTTGYVWANKTAGDALLLEGSDFAPAAPNLMGGGGQRTLRFLVAKPQTSTLLLKLMREWEGDSSVVEVFSVEIRAGER